MYKIIGADQREYGPVPAEQVRKWIAEGRADTQTKVRAEDAGEWKPLSDFPEFADALTARVPATRTAPPTHSRHREPFREPVARVAESHPVHHRQARGKQPGSA